MRWQLPDRVARASGIDFDLRRDMPYSGYENFQFKVPTSTVGDVWTRYLLRLEEMRESVKIISQALDGMPEGPVKANAPKIVLPDREAMKTQMEALIHHFKIVTEGFAVPAGEVYQQVESGHGQIGLLRGFRWYGEAVSSPHAVSGLCNACRRLRQCVRAVMLADVVAVIGSIDIVLGEIDR